MRVLVGLAVALTVISCGGSDSGPTTPPTSNKTYDVYTLPESFSPNDLQIAANDRVRWNFAKAPNGDGHNVRFFPRVAGSPSDIPVMFSDTVTKTFPTKGEFQYVCDVHPGMNGRVVVQ